MKTKNQLITILFLTLTIQTASAAMNSANQTKKDTTVPTASISEAAAQVSTSDTGPAVKTGSTLLLPIKTGAVDFYAVGRPSMLKIHGESAALSGNLNRAGSDLTGELKIPLDSFKTGMSTRDSHLKEKVFEFPKYESATLSITSLSVPAGNGTFKDLPFIGKLNLHGVEKAVSGTSQVVVSGESTDFTAHLAVKLTDFNIVPPEFMGMKILDDVKIDAKGQAKAQL